MSFLDPVSILVRFILLDGIYQSLWYVKSSIYRQNIKQQFSRFIKMEERYIYYLFVSFLLWNLKILMWFEPPPFLYEFPLSLPPLMTIVTEHPLFREQYLLLCDYLAIKFGDLFCVCLANLINLSGIHIFNQNKAIITHEETRRIYESLSGKTVILIIKTIVFGFVYDVFFYYLYNIFNTGKSKKDRYAKEIMSDIKKKRWENIVCVSGISKVFCIYYETDHEWFRKKMMVLKEKIWLERLRIASYWSLMAFIANITGNNIIGVITVILLLKWESHGENPLTVSELLMYLICIMMPYHLVNVILLLYVKRIDLYIDVKPRERTDMARILFASFIWSMIRNRGGYSGFIQCLLLAALTFIYLLVWNRRYLIEKIDMIEMYYTPYTPYTPIISKGEQWEKGKMEGIINNYFD